MPLLHTVYTRIGRAFWCLLFLIFLASCSQEDEVHFVEISEYYAESCHLEQVTLDSISSFSQKVAAFVKTHPEAKEDPLYPRILTNIRNHCQGLNLYIDPEWGGITEMGF